jgi:predicted permease
VSAWLGLTEKVRALFSPARHDREMDEEMRFHFEREAEARRSRGESAESARRGAALAFGSVDRFKEETLDATGVRPLQDAGTDLRFALRALRRNPGFALGAILVLGIGIGATAAAVAVVDKVLLSPLPHPHADRLVRVFPRQANSFANLSTVDYQAIRDQQRSFDAFGGLALRAVALAGAGEPRVVGAGRVTAGFFAALGVVPAEGRLIEPRDEVTGAPAVIVLSHAKAEELFGGAKAALGRTLSLDGVGHEVVGVLPASAGVGGLAGYRLSLWPALQMPTPTRRGPFWIRGIGRLKKDVTIAQATQDLGGISERIFPLWAAGFQDRDARFTPVPLRDAVVGGAGRGIGLFAAAVALVLLVAVANVATLVLVRSSAREQELAVRVSLGAPRARLARLVLIEGLTMTALAGLVGLLVAALGVRLAGTLAPGLPRLSEVSLGFGALAFVALATLAAGVLVSLPPLVAALAHGKRSGGAAASRAASSRVGTGRRIQAARTALVTAEFALALPLLAGAGLLFNSFLKLQEIDPGFDSEGVVTSTLSLPAARYADEALPAFWRRTEAQVAEIPGLAGFGLTSELPPSQPNNENNFDLVDRPAPSGSDQPTSPWVSASNGYFAALGVPLVDGRQFAPTDTAEAPPVALVSAAWQRRFYPGESAVGRQMVGGGCLECPKITVVGVVGDVKYLGLEAPGEAVYVPLEQEPPRTVHVVARAKGAPAEALTALREVARGLDAELPIVQGTLEERLTGELADPRRFAAILASFSAAAVVLAALGVFALMSYAVKQRQREIGVRIALGARPESVTWMIVGRGMRIALTGLAVGLVLVGFGARWLQSLLFGVGAADPITLTTVALALLATAFLACWLPGRSAARVAPARVLTVD